MRQHTSTVAGSAFAIALLVMAAPSVQASPGEGADWLWGGGVHFGLPTGDFDDAVDEGWGAAGHFVGDAARPTVSACAARCRRWSTAAADYETRPDDGYAGRRGPDRHLVRQPARSAPSCARAAACVRPYVHALAGLGYFATSTESGRSLRQRCSPRRHELRRRDVRLGGRAVASRSPSAPTSRVDLGARYLANGTVDYLTGEGISGGGNGVVPHACVAARRNVVTFTLGVSFGR